MHIIVSTIILLEFIGADSAKDVTANNGDKLVSKFVNRQIEAGPLLHANLDHTTFLKPGRPLLPSTLSSRLGTLRFQPLARAFQVHAPRSQLLVPISQFQNPTKTAPMSQCSLLTHHPLPFIPLSTSQVPHAEPKRPDWIRPQLHTWDPPVLPPGSVFIEKVRDDRNSFFRSLAYGLELTGLEEYEDDWLSNHPDGLSVRTRIAKFIMNNAGHCIADKELSSWVKYESNGVYKNTMEYGLALASGSLSGGFIEMSLFSHLWQVNLGVYRVSPETKGDAPEEAATEALDSSSPPNTDRLQHILDFASKQNPQGTVLILYSYGNSTSGQGHFDPLRPREASLVAPSTN